MHIAAMSDSGKTLDVTTLLDAVRGGADSAAGTVDWSAWDATLNQWVTAYPAFGAGRMLRAKTARETRSMVAGECLAAAAVFASEPGRLFDLLFRAGIESEIASFARAVEALEPEVEDALKWRWHPESHQEAGADEAVTEAEEAVGQEAQQGRVASEEEGDLPVAMPPVPADGTLAREVVLGAIERSIEREIGAIASEQKEEANPVSSDPLPLMASAQVDVGSLSPLARWAFERSRATGFVEAAESRLPSESLRAAAEQMEQVMGAAKGDVAAVPEGGLEQQAALIDLFIRNEPTISPIRPEIERPTIKELAKESLVEDASLITETMARIYAAQGQFGRARRAYKLLALKYPEKSVYFAAQSKKLGRKGESE